MKWNQIAQELAGAVLANNEDNLVWINLDHCSIALRNEDAELLMNALLDCMLSSASAGQILLETAASITDEARRLDILLHRHPPITEDVARQLTACRNRLAIAAARITALIKEGVAE